MMNEEQLWQVFCDVFIGDIEALVVILGLLDTLEAPIVTEEGCIHPPLCPVHVTSKIDPSQEQDAQL